jgi:hypothetical protein
MAPSINMVPPTRSVPFEVGTHEIEGNSKKQGTVFYDPMGKCDEISRIFSTSIEMLVIVPPFSGGFSRCFKGGSHSLKFSGLRPP